MSHAVASALVVPLLRCAAGQPWPTLAVVAALVAPVLRQGAKQLPPTAAALWCGASAARIAKVSATPTARRFAARACRAMTKSHDYAPSSAY